MKKVRPMKSIVIASVLLLYATPGVAEDARSTSPQPVTANLALPFATVLPGVPFDIEVTLTNTSRKPVKVGTIALLVVTQPDGTALPFSGQHWSRLQPFEPGNDGFIELAPAESARRVVGWNSWSPPKSQTEGGFSAPGVYDLAFDLEIGQYVHDEDLSNYVGRIRTSTARLRRVLPLGADEAIWNRMQEISGGRWTEAAYRERRQDDYSPGRSSTYTRLRATTRTHSCSVETVGPKS